MISSYQIQVTDFPNTSDITTFLHLQELTNVHPESKSRPCAICQSSSHARTSCVCLYVCGWMGFNTYVHVCLTGCLFTYLICLSIYKFIHPNWHVFMLKPESRQGGNCLYSLMGIPSMLIFFFFFPERVLVQGQIGV